MKEIDLKLISTIFFSLLIFGLVIYLFTSLSSLQSNTSEQQRENVESILYEASVQCYALEGSYPPDLDYLSDNYGVILDKSRYLFVYNLTASNALPTIMVIDKTAGGVVE